MKIYLVFGTDANDNVVEFLGARTLEAQAVGVCRGPHKDGGNDFILPVEIDSRPKAVDLPYHFNKWPGVYFPFSPEGDARKTKVISDWFKDAKENRPRN